PFHQARAQQLAAPGRSHLRPVSRPRDAVLRLRGREGRRSRHPREAGSIVSVGAVTLLLALAWLLLLPPGAAAQASDWERLTAAGDLAFNQGHYRDAARSYDEALTALEKAVPAEDPRLIGALNRLGLAWRSLGQAQDAEPLFRRAMAIAEKSVGPDAPPLATSMTYLGSVYQARARYPEAHPPFPRP